MRRDRPTSSLQQEWSNQLRETDSGLGRRTRRGRPRACPACPCWWGSSCPAAWASGTPAPAGQRCTPHSSCQTAHGRQHLAGRTRALAVTTHARNDEDAVDDEAPHGRVPAPLPGGVWVHEAAAPQRHRRLAWRRRRRLRSGSGLKQRVLGVRVEGGCVLREAPQRPLGKQQRVNSQSCSPRGAQQPGTCNSPLVEQHAGPPAARSRTWCHGGASVGGREQLTNRQLVCDARNQRRRPVHLIMRRCEATSTTWRPKGGHGANASDAGGTFRRVGAVFWQPGQAPAPAGPWRPSSSCSCCMRRWTRTRGCAPKGRLASQLAPRSRASASRWHRCARATSTRTA